MSSAAGHFFSLGPSMFWDDVLCNRVFKAVCRFETLPLTSVTNPKPRPRFLLKKLIGWKSAKDAVAHTQHHSSSRNFAAEPR
jgi:hypothetical protein